MHLVTSFCLTHSSCYSDKHSMDAVSGRIDSLCLAIWKKKWQARVGDSWPHWINGHKQRKQWMSVPNSLFLYIPSWAQPREWQHPEWAGFPISVSMIVVLSHNMLKPLSQVILDLLKVTTETNHHSLLAWFSVYFPSVQDTIRLLYPKFVFGYLVLQMMKSGSRAPILHCGVRLPPALLRGIFLLKS